MKTGIGAIVGLAVTMSGVPLLAHHTISAVYDVDKLVTLKGVVTEVDWRNPHVVIHLDVKNGDGSVVSWNVETRAIYILKRQGLDRDFIKTGDAASMNVFIARDGAQKAALESMTLPSGTLYVSMLPAGSRQSVPR
jgi:hypothetical protein